MRLYFTGRRRLLNTFMYSIPLLFGISVMNLIPTAGLLIEEGKENKMFVDAGTAAGRLQSRRLTIIMK